MGIGLQAIKALVRKRKEDSQKEGADASKETYKDETTLQRVRFADRLDEATYLAESLPKSKSIIPLSIKTYVQLAQQATLEKERVIFVTTRLQQLEDEEQSEEGGFGIGKFLGKFARFIGKKVVKKVVKFLLKKVARPILRFAIRFLAQAVRFIVSGIIRTIIAPIITGIIGFIVANPLTALLGIVLLGAGGFGYWAYNKFMGEKTPPPKEKESKPPGILKSMMFRMLGKSVSEEEYLPLAGEEYAITPSVPMATTLPQITEAELKRGKGLLAKRTPTVAAAIRHAAQTVGVNEGTLTAFAGVESSFNPNAGASTSSAKGLFQFTRSTWKATVARYGARYGVPENADIFDPVANALMGAAYLKHEVAPQIQKAVANPSAVDFYFGHFLGPGGGRNFLAGMLANPNAAAASLVGADQARANQWVFYDKKTGRAYTAQEVYNRFAAKFSPLEAGVTGEVATSALTSAVADKTTSKPVQSVVFKPGVSRDRAENAKAAFAAVADTSAATPDATGPLSQKFSTGGPAVPSDEIIRGKNGKLYTMSVEPI